MIVLFSYDHRLQDTSGHTRNGQEVTVLVRVSGILFSQSTIRHVNPYQGMQF
jgi:hypothetical protein